MSLSPCPSRSAPMGKNKLYTIVSNNAFLPLAHDQRHKDNMRNSLSLPAMPSSSRHDAETSANNPFPELSRELRRDVSCRTLSTRCQLGFFSVHGLLHICSPDKDEPFAGLLTLQTLSHACCPLKAFMQLQPGQLDYNKSLTQYGKRLWKHCIAQDTDLRFLLCEQYYSSWSRVVAETYYCDLRKYLSSIVVTYFDDDSVSWRFDQCSVCLVQCRYVRVSPCCCKSICQLCWLRHIRASSVWCNNVYNLKCLACKTLIPYGEAMNSSEPSEQALIRPISLVPNATYCPFCFHQHNPSSTVLDESVKKLHSNRAGGYPIACERCQSVFCLLCGQRPHHKKTCSQLSGANYGCDLWLKMKSPDNPKFRNGRRCPSCTTPVSHDGGCPLITCQCGTTFCFHCGHRQVTKHFSNFHFGMRFLPFLSCPKLWHSNCTRILVHSLISFVIFTILGPLAIGLLPIAFPIWLCYHFFVQKKSEKDVKETKFKYYQGIIDP